MYSEQAIRLEYSRYAVEAATKFCLTPVQCNRQIEPQTHREKHIHPSAQSNSQVVYHTPVSKDICVFQKFKRLPHAKAQSSQWAGYRNFATSRLCVKYPIQLRPDQPVQEHCNLVDA